MFENVTFQNYGSHRLRNRFDKQGLSNTDLQTANPAKHFLEQSRTQETWKCKLNRKENRVKNLKKDLARTRNAYTNCSAGVILWMKQSDKKVSFDDPQNGGHFSCRKPVSHVGTSTVSDSEALIHLAYVQHMWQSKFCCYFGRLDQVEDWIVFKDATSWEWLQMHFDMHVLLAGKSFAMQLWQQKLFANFAPFFDPKMEVEKWTQKWCQNLIPKMGSKNGTQKGGLIFFWFKKDLQEIKALFKILDLPFGCHFWTPFWGSNSGTIFGSIFQPPFWGRKMVQNLQKFLLSKLHSKTFSSK